MKLIVGLGNPGRRYAASRHNVGFMCVDHLARRLGISFSERSRYVVLGQGEVEEEAVVLAKPRTFMNLSGEAASYLLTRFCSGPGDLIVIYDEMDLPLGAIRLRPGGSSAGHGGVESIISALGSQDFPRMRVGVGKPDDETDPIDYVLGPFTSQERKVIQEVIPRAGDALECLLREGIAAAMNRFN